MRAVFETVADLGLEEDEKMDLNKKSIFLAADFATEEMCSFQDRSDETKTPHGQVVTHFESIRTKENIWEIFVFAPRN